MGAHLPDDVKAIELGEELHEGALDLAVGRGALAEAPAADGVDLVHEDDAGLVLLGVPKHLADQPRALADVLVHDGRRHHLEEVGVNVGRNCARQQCLACTASNSSLHSIRIPTFCKEECFITAPGLGGACVVVAQSLHCKASLSLHAGAHFISHVYIVSAVKEERDGLHPVCAW